MVLDINSVDFQPKINAIGEVVEGYEDIKQCINTILSTPKGSVPHRPEFGSDCWKYVDFPVDQAIPNMIREAIDAIKIWETRIDVSNVYATVEEQHIKINVQWNIKGTDNIQNSEVLI